MKASLRWIAGAMKRLLSSTGLARLWTRASATGAEDVPGVNAKGPGPPTPISWVDLEPEKYRIARHPQNGSSRSIESPRPVHSLHELFRESLWQVGASLAEIANRA